MQLITIMITTIDPTRLFGAMLLLVSGAAAAWTPYVGAPAYGDGPQPADAETQPSAEGRQQVPPPPYPAPTLGPYARPAWSGTRPIPQAPDAAQLPAYPGQPGGAGPQAPGRLRLSPEIRDDAYVLIIDLDGRDPAEIDVSARPNTLLITSRRSAETSNAERFDDGRGYRRGWSWSSGQSSRRLPVPPDADLSRMRREQGDQQVRIIIPRRQAPGSDAQ